MKMPLTANRIDSEFRRPETAFGNCFLARLCVHLVK